MSDLSASLKIRTIRLLLVAILVGIASEARSVDYGVVRGRVVDEHGTLVTGAQVAFLYHGMTAAAIPIVPSDDRGQFSVGLQAGTYSVFAWKATPAKFDIPITPPFFDNGIPTVEVHPPDAVSGVIVRLTREGLIGGAVIDCTNGLPIPNAQIRVSRADDSRLWQSDAPAATGAFQIVVPVRPLTIRVTADGYVQWAYPPMSSVREAFTVPADQRLTLVIKLRPVGKECRD